MINVVGRWSAVPVKASTNPSPPPPLFEASAPKTDTELVVEVVSPGLVELVVELPSVVVLVVDVELDVELVLLVELVVVLVVEVDEVVVAAVEKLREPMAPVVMSFGLSATRMVQAF